jgi:DNA repair protein RadC
VKSPPIGKCRPYIRIERDEEAFAACNALADEIGPLDEPPKVFRVIEEAIGSEVVEVFGVITLDIHKRLRGIHITGRGEEQSVMAPIKSTVRAAAVDGADSVIIFHIHPSGVEAEPSDEDISTTEEFVKAFETVEISLLDHIIIGGDIKNPSYYSFLEDNAL